MGNFFDKDPSKAYEQVKEVLYARLKTIKDNIIEYDTDEIATDSEAVHEYLYCLNEEKSFISKLIDKIERS